MISMAGFSIAMPGSLSTETQLGSARPAVVAWSLFGAPGPIAALEFHYQRTVDEAARQEEEAGPLPVPAALLGCSQVATCPVNLW